MPPSDSSALMTAKISKITCTPSRLFTTALDITHPARKAQFSEVQFVELTEVRLLQTFTEVMIHH